MGGEIAQLITMALPTFLVAIAGFVLAGIFMPKARTAAILVLIASLLSLVHIAYMCLQQFVLIEMLYDDRISGDLFGLISSGIYNGLYLIISALMLGAAFTGRHQPVTNAPQNTAINTNAAPHRGGLVLTLGLLGVLLFAPVGIVAWILGGHPGGYCCGCHRRNQLSRLLISSLTAPLRHTREAGPIGLSGKPLTTLYTAV